MRLHLPTFGRGLNKVAQFLGSTANNWEGHGIDRRWENIPRAVTSQDETVETDREQIIGAARTMCQLFGLGNRILRTYANYTVGGCEVSWHTDNETWNDKTNELFAAKRGLLDVRGREDFSGLGRMAVIHMLRDGDLGFVKVNNPGFPMVEPVEADRIGPRSVVTADANLVGGVKTDSNSRPTAYYVAKRRPFGFDPGRLVSAADFMHVYDNLRFDATRGVSAFAQGALGRSRTLRQLIRCEEVGVQTANKWAVLIKMANAMTGGMPGLNLSDDNTEVTSGASGNPLKVAELHDGMVHMLEPGEDVTSVGSNRPSTTWQGFIEFLIRDFAISLDLPYEFVWNMSALTGPAVRMTSRQAERTFAWTWSVVNRRFLSPLVAWWVADQMQQGILPFNADWMNFVIQRPAHPTIDSGRESQANISEYDKGFISGLEIAGERGQNIFVVMRQKAREVAYAYELADEFKIPVSSIIMEGKGNGVAPSPASPQESDPKKVEDNEDEPKPDAPKRGGN